jgi:hypothetical protein
MMLLSARAIDRRDFEGWMIGFAGHTPALDALYMLYGCQAKLDPTQMTAEGAIDHLRSVSQRDGTHDVQKSGSVSADAKEPIRRVAN